MTYNGFTMTGKLTGVDGNYAMDFDYVDTSGNTISKTVAGNNPYKMLDQLTDEIIDEINSPENEPENEVDEEVDEYVAQLEAMVQELQEKNSSLERDISILQRRADDAVKDSKNEKDTDVRSAWFSDEVPAKNYSLDELNELVRKFFRNN